MDALVSAFVAALLAGIGDRPARLAALIGTRAAVGGLIVGHGVGIAIAVAGAFAIAPLLTPEAKILLVAVALILTGVNGFRRRALADPSARSVFLIAATTGFVGGDGAAFLAFALGTQAFAPVMAGVGAFAGALMLVAVAVSLGRDWRRLPLALLSRMAGAVLIATGLVLALGGLRLI